MTQKDTKNFLEKNFFFLKFIFLIIPFLKIIEHIMRFLYIPLMPNLNFQKIFFKVFKKIIYTIFVSFRVVSCRVMSYGVVSCPFMSCRVISIGQSSTYIHSATMRVKLLEMALASKAHLCDPGPYSKGPLAFIQS